MKRTLFLAEQRALEPLVGDAIALPEIAAQPVDGVAVRVEQAAKWFGEHLVLDNITFDVAPAQCVAVVGRAGSGKSTLLRMIAGLERASAGSILLGDAPVAAPHGDVGILFPQPRLLPWHRVLSNVGIARRADWRAGAAAALDDVGLADRAEAWPASLSDGQRQRVALARALVRRPKLLLMDEPFGALDTLARAELHQLLIRIRRAYGFTGLLMTHDVREALALADRILVLRDGGLVLDERVDVPPALRRTSPRLSHLEQRIRAEL